MKSGKPEAVIEDGNPSMSETMRTYIEQFPSISPSYYFFGGSIPLLYRAYRGYHTSLNPLVDKVMKTQNDTLKIPKSNSISTTATANATIASIEAAEDGIRRAFGFAVAGRALRVATFASAGFFCLTLSVLFSINGWTTTQQAITETRRWSSLQRKYLDTYLGITSRIDENHPESLATKNMSEEEEYDHISQTYFAYDSEDESDSPDSSSSDQ